MKHLFLFYTIIVILFLGCSKDENQDFDEFSKDSGTFIDERDGHEYKWVKIGEQIWMAENLAYLPEVYPLRFQSYTDPYYFVLYYDGNDAEEAKDTENYKNYGVLYNWTQGCSILIFLSMLKKQGMFITLQCTKKQSYDNNIP